MTLAQARALHAEVQFREHEPDRDAVALEALARWMMRFTPTVALSNAMEEAGEIRNRKSRIENRIGLFLDLTGCERVFGGLQNLLARISGALRHFHINASLGLAPNPGAAWAMACGGARSNSPALAMIAEGQEIPAAIESLPSIALRISTDTAIALHHLGIETIGQLIRLPRNMLPARFGPELLQRLDQALGVIPEPLVPLEPFSPIEARMDFEGSVDSLEAIWIVFKKLITRIVIDLLRRGHGARELAVEFYRPYAITLHKTIHLSRPSRDPGNLFNLLRCAMETVQTDVGFLGIKLIVVRSERISDEQIQLLEHEEFAADTELDHLIERLRIRLGNQIIARPALVEAYVPEKAYEYCASGAVTRSKSPARAESPCHGHHEFHIDAIRPLHLFNVPQEIGVIVSPSHDRDGRPISFTWRGQANRLVHSVGPERIAGQWWNSHHKTRDYFDVEAPDGRRFWIFRVMESGKWYVQGEFE